MRTRTKAGIVVLAAVLSLLAGAGIGSVFVSPADICRVLANRLFGSPLPENFSSVTPGLVLNIRLPRVTLSFAAGAMIYVVVEELIPESQDGHHSNIATIGVAAGFTLMMILDVALG